MRPDAAEPTSLSDTAPAKVRHVVATSLRIGILNELQYRVNLFLQLFESVIALGTALAVLAVVFGHTSELDGWSPPELLTVMAIHTAMGGFIRAFVQPNMTRLIADIRDGKLDFALTKPVDAQLYVSTREVQIWQLVDVLVGAGLLTYAILQLDRTGGLLGALAFAVAVLLGAVMVYCFWLILTIGAFWIVRMENIIELFDGVYQAGRWPVTIYPGWLRVGFTFLVPLAFAITVPAEAVTGRLSPSTLALAAAFAGSLVLVTRGLWRLGVRRYDGASA